MSFKAYLENINHYYEWTYDIRPSDSLYTCIALSYEWEYKYRKIAGDPKLFTKRKDNMLKLIEERMAPVFENIFGAMIETFEFWLDLHNLDDPISWSDFRFIDVQKRVDGFNIEDMLNHLWGEYQEVDKTKTYQEFMEWFVEEEFNTLMPVIKIIMRNRNKNTEPTITSLKQSNQFSEVAKEVFDNAIKYKNDEIYKKALHDFGHRVFFPIWEKHWEKEGIYKTQNRIVDVYNQAIDYHDFTNFNRTIVLMHKLLNTGHQTGDMMDYIADHYDVTKKDLDEFSATSNFDHWNKDLNAMGIYVSAGE